MEKLTETQAKIDTYHARLADPTIPADEWERYQLGEASPTRTTIPVAVCPTCGSPDRAVRGEMCQAISTTAGLFFHGV